MGASLSSHSQRFLTAAVIIPFLFAYIFWGGPLLFALLVWVVFSWEPMNTFT